MIQEKIEMKVKQSELDAIVKEVADRISLKETADFTATRRIQHAAAEASMNFEDIIVKELKLIHPDKMAPEVQQAYTAITDGMQKKIISAVLDALSKLENFPRENDSVE